jgi:hypothetical protein
VVSRSYSPSFYSCINKSTVKNLFEKIAFDALERYGITPHVMTFRHRYFWDGGIHGITTDLRREGAGN